MGIELLLGSSVGLASGIGAALATVPAMLAMWFSLRGRQDADRDSALNNRVKDLVGQVTRLETKLTMVEQERDELRDENIDLMRKLVAKNGH